jgi:hypothetical protein
MRAVSVGDCTGILSRGGRADGIGYAAIAHGLDPTATASRFVRAGPTMDAAYLSGGGGSTDDGPGFGGQAGGAPYGGTGGFYEDGAVATAEGVSGLLGLGDDADSEPVRPGGAAVADVHRPDEALTHSAALAKIIFF